MIRFNHVTKAYADTSIAVHDLTLEIPSGKITTLVGPSGCGKTTSLRMINRMVDPTSGSITIDGADIASGSVTELRRSIGYVIQQAGLFPNKTVAENIATVPRLLGHGRRRSAERAGELMELVGLNPNLRGRYPWQLSGGQQQRVGVARALAADPPVLLMDEPFSAVDPVVRTQLQDELLRLQAELSKTIVFVTHDIDEAIRIGDKVGVLRPGGMLAQFDSPAQLLGAPADAFVADFLGKDRGYRALGFRAAGRLPLRTERTARIGDPLPTEASMFDAGWMIAVDAADRPVGWLSLERARAADRATGTVSVDLLNLGGTLADADGSLRSALDAALSSPSGRGVIVDNAGAMAGTVLASEVLTRIQRTRGAETDTR